MVIINDEKKTGAEREKQLELILAYLKDTHDFDFHGYRPSMVERRINKRLTATNSLNYHEYLHYLEKHPHELDELVDVLTINVSSFFRDPLVFEYIEKEILPAIVSKTIETKDYSLRIWSAACAAGEEPYSIAIMMHELLKKEAGLNLNIFATDVDERITSKAKEAVYPAESIKNVKYGLLERYFTKAGNSFKLNPEIKELADFSLYDLLDKKSYAPPESVFGNFDMVFCRNVLIYFIEEYQEVIFSKLYRALAGNGYLVLGEAEAPSIKYQQYFRRVNECCHIYQKIG